MMLQRFSQRWASRGRGSTVWGLTALMVGTLGISTGRAQSAPEIDVSSIEIRSGTVFSFQFQAAGQATDAFGVEITSDTTTIGPWDPASGVEILALAEGWFQVSVAMPNDRLFCRVRVLDSGLPGPPLLINEVMSDNVTVLADADGAFWDWIEIYNPNDEAVDIDRYALTDDETALDKWRFPARFIQPHAHLLVYASDLDRSDLEAALHASFKLKASGETLILSDAALRLLDRYQIPALAPDQSVGRVPDGAAALHFYAKTESTPGSENLVITTDPVVLPPSFTPDGGFFDEPVTVRILGAETNHVVRYTLDGSAPTAQSQVWSSPLTLDTSTVVRVIALDPQGEQSASEVRSFFVGVDASLPVLSLATAPSHLAFRDGYLYGLGPSVLSSRNQVLKSFPYYGSYAWADREVEIAMEFFETNRTVGLRQRAGMKIFGGWGSRGYPQKSFALFARRSYGTGKFAYRVFPDCDIDAFEGLILRNSGNDNQSTHQTPLRPPITEFGPTSSYGSYFANGHFTLLRDAFMQRLIQDTGLDTQAYRPAVVYLNGGYWGIYNIREKMNEAYVLSHHNLSGGSVDLIEGYGTVNAGNDTVYDRMRDYLSSENMAESDPYAFVAEHYLDIDNFINYQLAVIYFQNFDIGNIKCWRPRTARGRFRWMVYDQDYGFDLWPPDVYGPAMARDYADYDNMFRY